MSILSARLSSGHAFLNVQWETAPAIGPYGFRLSHFVRNIDLAGGTLVSAQRLCVVTFWTLGEQRQGRRRTDHFAVRHLVKRAVMSGRKIGCRGAPVDVHWRCGGSAPDLAAGKM
jgi:hypothetical protein